MAWPLANLERFYACLCRAAGLKYQERGALRWYDWLASDQVIRVFFADWQDIVRANEELYPWLLRNSQAVSVLTWEPIAPALPDLFEAAGLENSLQAWGMELVAPAEPAGHVLDPNVPIVSLVETADLSEYAHLVGSHLTGQRSGSMFAAFADLLAAGLSAGLRCLAIRDADGRMVATASLFCDSREACGGIYHVVTLPDCRGRGLARGLVEQATVLARNSGMEHVILQTAIPNARRIYERIGFRKTTDYRRWTRKEVIS